VRKSSVMVTDRYSEVKTGSKAGAHVVGSGTFDCYVRSVIQLNHAPLARTWAGLAVGFGQVGAKRYVGAL
jgi:hypothetical protein